MQDIATTSHSAPAEEPGFDFRSFFQGCLSQWKWFVISLLAFLLVGYVYLRRQPVVYQCNASVLIKQENTVPEEMLLLQDLGIGSGKNNIDNEIGILKSPDLIAKIVTSLDLYTVYRYKGWLGFYTPELYGDSPLLVKWEDRQPDAIPATVELLFTQEEESFAVTVSSGDSLYHRTLTALPAFLELPVGRFYVARNGDVPFEGRTLSVSIRNALSVARTISEREITIVPSSKQSSLLNITLKSENKKWGEKLLQALIRAYNEDATADKNMVASNTALFIDERLKDIAVELSTVEGEVESFRKKHNITDVAAEVQLYMDYTGTNEARRIEIETQLNLIRYIEDFLNDPKSEGKLIPNLGISDSGLLLIINGYNEVVAERDKRAESMTTDNPVMQQLNAQIEGLRKGIRLSLANQRHASQITLQEIDRQSSDIQSRISAIPTIERQFADVMRQQVVKDNLFTFLLQKREEVSLTQAGVAPKAKLISRPYAGSIPVAPKAQLIFATVFLLGLFVPAGVLFLIDVLHVTILGMKDLDQLRNIPVVGDVAKVNIPEGETALQVKANDDTLIAEMFRTLRNNLLFMLGGGYGKVILLTSTVQKEGKTFVSVNLGQSIALMDKRVLLIGADLRNPQVTNAIGLPRTKRGLSTYLAGIDSDIRPLIAELTPTLHVLPAGAVPPNPNELLSKPLLDELIARLKNEYDYILIDTAPVGIVSDTFVLNRLADRVLYVVREGYTRRDSIDFINDLNNEGRLTNLGIVLNGSSLGNGHYGKYNYKYKYKYRYSYRYRYGSDGRRHRERRTIR